MGFWTDEEIFALIRLWPTHSIMQIANTLHRSHAAIRRKTTELRSEVCWKARMPRGCDQPNPTCETSTRVKSDYCRKHRITIAELDARFERDNQLAAQLYRQAQAAKPTRLRSRQADGKAPTPVHRY